MSSFIKHEYWLELCDDDLVTAKWLLQGKRLLHCGYMCHQIIEKSFKAVIARNSNEIPPKIHDLYKLAKIGGLWDNLSEQQLKLIDDLMPMQIEVRYPEYKEKVAETLSTAVCEKLLEGTEALLCWIKQRLGK